MLASLHTDLLICIALAAGPHDDEYVFNTLARAVPMLGRWTIASNLSGDACDGTIINHRLDLMIIFGYSVTFPARTSCGVCSNIECSQIFWRKYGDRHRNEAPAIINSEGCHPIWYKHGKLHRTDGPARWGSMDLELWYQNGKMHRTDSDGPALIWYGRWVEWYQHGERRRPATSHKGIIPEGENGPVYISADGTTQWYRRDQPYYEQSPSAFWRDECKKWFAKKNDD